MIRKFVATFLVFLNLYAPVAWSVPTTTATESWNFELPSQPSRSRNYFLPPLLSFLLPGFDQWWEGQYLPALAYSGGAVVGEGLLYFARQNFPIEYTPSLTSKDDAFRFAMLGSQMYLAAGSFSAYHSFRTAVRSRQHKGDFSFLTVQENVPEILAAPVNFSFVTRFTTILPLLVIASTVAIELATNHSIQAGPVTASDVGFAAGFSYLAGTNEEALFRGWLMPMGMHWTGSPLVANLGQGLLFAAAHISDANPIPWPQLLMGVYLGWLSQYRDWTLAEGIFIHTWWDIISFIAEYSIQQTGTSNSTRNPVLWLPTINMRI